MSLTFDEIKQLLDMGFTPEQITVMTKGESAEEETKSSKKATKKAKGQGKTNGMSYVEPFRMDRNNNEIEKIYNSMKSDRDKLYVIVSVYMAYRVSDTLTLTFGQLREDVVKILEKKTMNTKKDPKPRIMAVNDRVKKELDKFADKDDHEYCFVSRQGGKPMTRQQAHNLVTDAAEKIGLIKRAEPVGKQRKGNIISLKRYGTHSLRKAFGYFLWKNGRGITEIMEMYGHTNPSVTRAYLGIDQAEKNAISETIDYGF